MAEPNFYDDKVEQEDKSRKEQFRLTNDFKEEGSKEDKENVDKENADDEEGEGWEDFNGKRS